jgi:sialate O-acetylesterase
MKKWILFILPIILHTLAQGQVRLPRLISDNMVLQRDIQVNIWGWATAGEQVTVSFMDQQYEIITGADGRWKISLPPMKAGGPYDMQIKGSNELTIRNILIGDVWVCSGQSNMELSMDRLKDKYPAVIASAANPAIRQFNVATRMEWQQPQQDYAGGSWEMATSQSVLQFTGVGYFFARTLYEKYHVPIGIIKAASGGSTAEAWLSDEGLRQFPGYAATAASFKRPQYVDSLRRRDKENNDNWYATLWQKDAGMQAAVKWFDTSYHANGWKTMRIPGYWHDQGLPDVHGVVWFRKRIQVPPGLAAQPSRLFLGNIVDRDSVYLNGQLVGTTPYQYPPRKYNLPAGTLRTGDNTLVIRVINYSGKGGFYKDKPYRLFAGKDTVDLQGEWQYKMGASLPAIPPAVTYYTQPLGLFNGMIAPMLPYAIKGVIWYQGEANTRKPEEYHTLFAALINNWRQQWNGVQPFSDFPFLYAQLTSFMEVRQQPSASNWAMLREAQLKTLSVPNTAMAVTTDIGEWNDIHPLNKEDVGKRLALAAQYLAYKDSMIVYAGPQYEGMKIEGNEIVLRFTHTGSGLAIRGDSLQHFAIAGPDKRFRWAHAKIVNNEIRVWHESIPHPVAVRYAWADNAQGANLYNKEGLPASPFRTDNFMQ